MFNSYSYDVHNVPRKITEDIHMMSKNDMFSSFVHDDPEFFKHNKKLMEKAQYIQLINDEFNKRYNQFMDYQDARRKEFDNKLGEEEKQFMDSQTQMIEKIKILLNQDNYEAIQKLLNNNHYGIEYYNFLSKMNYRVIPYPKSNQPPKREMSNIVSLKGGGYVFIGNRQQQKSEYTFRFI